MLATMSYETAKQLDNAQNIQWNLLFVAGIIICLIGLGVILFKPKAQYIGLTVAILGGALIIGDTVWKTNIPNHVQVVINHELPTLQRKVEQLKGQRLEAVHHNKSSKAINDLNNQIANTQSTINKYNNALNQINEK